MSEVHVYQRGLAAYAETWRQQQSFTETRGPGTPDQIWCLEHPPVYTLGLAGRPEHLLDPGRIPVQRTDRGGQVTYHGPGQLVVYLLLDLQRRGLTVKAYVRLLEQAIIDMLAAAGVEAGRMRNAPGVYVAGSKIAALGIRVRKGCCYHGIALNVDMDLSPFAGINPCGFPGLDVTQLSVHGPRLNVEDAALMLVPHLAGTLGYAGLDWRGDVTMEATA